MKRKHLSAIAIIAITFGIFSTLQSCTKLAKLLNFSLGMQTETVNVTIPVTSGTNGTVTVGPTTNSFNVDSFIKAQTGNQLGAANVSSVKLASVIFTLNNANSLNNFQNFESCSATFSSNTNSTPFTVSIADNPDVYSNTLSLPVDSTTELKSYIGNEFNYTVSGKLRRGTTIPLDCTVTFTFNLKVSGTGTN